jgi:signal transduction histidine kinase
MSAPHFQKNDRLLIIDDNPAIHADFRKILQRADILSAGLDAAGAELFDEVPRPSRRLGFQIESAASGEEGLALVQAAQALGQPYALAFVDVRMAPGWNGIETTARICQVDRDIQIVICTAYSDYSWEEMIEKLGQSDRLVILKKPFDTVEVLQLAHALTAKWEMGQKARARMDQLEVMVAARTSELQATLAQLQFEIAERAKTEEHLRQAQKMEAVGQLAGGIAHDFNNLLTVIRGYVQILNVELRQHAGAAEALHEIDVAADRAAKLTAQMLLFSRQQRMQPQAINLNEVIGRFGNRLRQLVGANITLELQAGTVPLTVHADPAMVEMMVVNLAANARDAMPRGGCLTITAGKIEITDADCRDNSKAQPGPFAWISVADTGTGIPAAVLPHLFEPFFTTKEVGQGTGLGLASAYGIVKQHGGWIEVSSQPGHGATFKIFLPLKTPAVRPASSPAPALPGASVKETILLADDEQPLRRLARILLERRGYRVLEAASGADALSVWAAHGSEIDLLVTDMIMPGGLSGRELAARLREQNPGLKIIYTTGYSPDVLGSNLTLSDASNFLAKPYDPEKLIQTVRACLDAPAPAQLAAAVEN